MQLLLLSEIPLIRPQSEATRCPCTLRLPHVRQHGVIRPSSPPPHVGGHCGRSQGSPRQAAVSMPRRSARMLDPFSGSKPTQSPRGPQSPAHTTRSAQVSTHQQQPLISLILTIQPKLIFQKGPKNPGQYKHPQMSPF